MGRKIKDAEFSSPETILTPTASSQPHEHQLPEEEPEVEADQTDNAALIGEEADEDEGEKGGEVEGSGGGPIFEEVEDTDFDQTELQGMPLPSFRKALKKGLGLVSRVTKQSEYYLKDFLPDKNLRARVVEVALSKLGHPTLLLDKGEIVQYQLAKGKLERVRVSPDLDAERAVKYAMAGFIAAGESVNPKHVKFGRSPEFEARMKPIWIREWKQMQKEDNKFSLNGMRKAISFKLAVDFQAPMGQIQKHPAVQAQPVVEAPAEPREEPAIKSILNLPRAGGPGTHEPEF